MIPIVETYTTKSMVGLLPLAPHHNQLQNIHHVPFNANEVKTRVLQSPPPWNNTILGVPILKNTYIVYTSKILKFCRSVPCSIIYFELSGPSPLDSTRFSYWFSAFDSSPSQGTLWLLPSLCSLVGQSRHK